MKISKLTLRNFKGVQELVLTMNGENVTVCGDNATGKTTIFDAFTWLLFEKDSLNRKDFGIKTLDQNGEAIHGLEHEVTGEFIEPTLTLRKVYKEKWTKQRGSSESLFSGHTVDYFINDIPSKKSEFVSKVDEIAREDIFKLLSNPLYVNNQLHWQDRRKLLFEVCGDVSDLDVIQKNAGLKELGVVLFEKKRSLEDHKKYIASKLKEINQEIERIPTRIDEVKRSMEDVSNLDLTYLKGAIETLEYSKKQKQDELNLLENGGEILHIKKQIAEVEAQMSSIKYKFEMAKADAKTGQYKKFSEISSKHSQKQNEINTTESYISSYKAFIVRVETEVQELREKVVELSKKECQLDCNCFACGQALPEEKVQEALEKYNLDKSNKIESIRAEGKQLVGSIESKKLLLQEKSEELGRLKVELELLAKQKDDNEYTFDDDRKVENESDYKNLLIQKQGLEFALGENEIDKTIIIESKANISKYDDEIKALNTDIARLDANQKAKSRVEELIQQERKLSGEHQDYSKQSYLCEEFVKTKVDMITEQINSKFKIAKWKLFNTQINGGIEDCCETVVEGVPFSDLNNAMKINVGIDIINTLSKHYDISVPVFADNAESVTEIAKTEGQLIRLVVSEKDKALRIEIESNNFAISA